MSEIQVPKVENIANYYEDMFGKEPQPGIPAFQVFLETQRKIPKDFFSLAAYEAVAIQLEFGFYTQYLQANAAALARKEKEAEQEKNFQDFKSQASLQDLLIAQRQFEAKKAEIDAEIEKLAQNKESAI